MADFRTFRNARRLPAEPMKPLADPAGWAPEELKDLSGWTYALSAREQDELIEAVAALRRGRIPVEEVNRDNFVLKGLAEILDDFRMELRDGRGAVRLSGFPVDRLDREGVTRAYLGLGAHIGTLEPQNKHGHLIGHIRNFRDERMEAEGRGYNTARESSFHVDSTDYVGLLCLSQPKSGGNSRIASSVTVYNRILAERPDLIDALMMDFYKTRYGEEVAGEAPYYKTPVFAFVDGYFSALGYSVGFERAQSLPGVPPMTEKQKEAAPVYRRVVEECSIDMQFRKGDIQFLNNYVVVHSRRAFEDGPRPDQKRHLLRLWLNDPVGRPIPADRGERRNRGLYLKHVKRVAPLELDAPAPV